MARGRHAPVETDRVVETLAELIDDGETIATGGVTVKRLSAELPYHTQSLFRTMNELVGEDEVKLVWGITDDGPKKSFVPATDGGDSA